MFAIFKTVLTITIYYVFWLRIKGEQVMGFWSSLLRPSNFPEKEKTMLENEGLLFLTEGSRITVVYKNFKSRHKRYTYKKEVLFGSLAISQKSLVGFGFRKRIIHLPFADEKAKKVKFSCFENKVLVIAFDPSLFMPETSGSMEIRYHFDDAAEAYKIIKQQIFAT